MDCYNIGILYKETIGNPGCLELTEHSIILKKGFCILPTKV